MSSHARETVAGGCNAAKGFRVVSLPVALCLILGALSAPSGRGERPAEPVRAPAEATAAGNRSAWSHYQCAVCHRLRFCVRHHTTYLPESSILVCVRCHARIHAPGPHALVHLQPPPGQSRAAFMAAQRARGAAVRKLRRQQGGNMGGWR